MLSADTSTTKKRKARAKKPRHPAETRTYKFALDPMAEQSLKMHQTVHACWLLRQHLVEERRRDREANREKKQAGQEVTYIRRSDQYGSIPGYKKLIPEIVGVYSQVLQDVAVRVDEGCQRAMEAIKARKGKVHFPHLIARKRYKSFTYPQWCASCRLTRGILRLPGIGDVRVRDHRRMRGKPKTITVKFMQGRWYGFITCEIQAKDLYQAITSDLRPDTAIDTGLSATMTDAGCVKYDPPKAWHDERRNLARDQRVQSRQFEARKPIYEEWKLEWVAQGVAPPSIKQMPRSNRLKAQIRKVAKRHARIANVRDYHHKKNARIVAYRYRLVAVEEHGVQFMIRNRKLAKLAADRAIHQQKRALKSVLGPGRYVPVSTRDAAGNGNSQICICGTLVPKELGDRVHACPSCGLVAERDHVSANVVQKRAFNTTSDSLQGYYNKGPGQGLKSGGDAKGGGRESAAAEFGRRKRWPWALEVSKKRKAHATGRSRKSAGGKPTARGKTRRHQGNPLARAPSPGSP